MKTLPVFASITHRIRNLFAFSLFAILTLATVTITVQAQGTVQNLVATVQPDQVTLIWKPPVATTGQLNGYRVFRNSAAGTTTLLADWGMMS